jgi:hypothetical protein
MTKLEWNAAMSASTPASKPDGDPFDVFFINQRKDPVKLFWMDRHGKPKPYGAIAAGKWQRQKKRQGAVWLITDQSDQRLGHFTEGDHSARALIPP